MGGLYDFIKHNDMGMDSNNRNYNIIYNSRNTRLVLLVK